MYSSVHWTSHVLQGTRNTGPCITGDLVGCVWSPAVPQAQQPAQEDVQGGGDMEKEHQTNHHTDLK